MPYRTVTFLLAVALSPSLAWGATNLIANSRFDVGIAGWVAGAGEATVSWSPVDELDNPGSGSLRMTNLDSTSSNTAWGSCFAVTPGAALVFGGSAYSTATSGPYETAFLRVRFYDGPNCSGSDILHLDPDQASYYALGASTWGPIQGNGETPAAAQSAFLTFTTSSWKNPPSELYLDNVYVYEGESCATTATVACMNDRRFRVVMSWEIPDGTHGYGSLVAFSGDSLRATFFDPSNVEAVLKVLDGCGVNQRYWVFAAGLTNVEVKIRVTDTQTGEVWEHENPLDEAFAPVQDTSAFTACPH